ncbi:NAD(+) diphosphatase [Pseudactinotalea terrae]|uniref:NAD(+) diphosphatase n=1 Tax=Pseudactinotalea terrae TaxID=1743262 RepID=UPI0012E1420B|nr:NAD(+) diphosphatase [Pseudactinotalea terrae]
MDSDALPLSRGTVDRDARRRSEGIEAILADPRLRVLRVRLGRVAGDEHGLALGAAVEAGAEAAYLGRDAEGWSYVADLGTGLPEPDPGRALDDPQGPPSGISVRDVGWQLEPRDAGLAAAALAMANWHGSHRFCPRCGAPTTIALAGWERRCAAEGSAQYPRTDAAVIMAIVDDDDRLLLGHGVAWPATQFSVPAGFVEPGETLEAAVRREVAEETAIEVGEVTYQGSQPWPFPASLMLGFRGRAVTTEPRPDGVEVTEAMFVTRDELTELLTAGTIRLPRPTSIAHYLIRDWYGREWPTTPWISG